MSPILVLLMGALGTYALRLLFIALVPAHLLPRRLRATLQSVSHYLAPSHSPTPFAYTPPSQ